METTITRRICLGILAATFALGCGQPAQQGPEAAAEPTAAWTKAFNAGDPAALAALYAEHARSLPPDSGAIVGRDSIESYWRADIGEGGVTTTLTPVDATGAGDLLHVEGTYKVSGPKGVELAGGQYQQLWRRAAERWEVEREIWRIDPALQRETRVADGLTESWTSAYNAGNVEALVALYAEDAALSSVQNGTINGRPAIESYWVRDLAGTTPTSTLTVTDVYIAGDMAHLEGDYSVTDGGAVTDGRYIQLWMRDATGWRIHREMWWR